MPEPEFERVRESAEGAAGPVGKGVERALARRPYYQLFDAWESAVRRSRPNLERGLILLGQAGRAEGVADVEARLDQMAEAVGDRLAGDRAFDVGLTVMAEVLGRRFELRGNEEDYHDPANAYLQTLLQRGLGIPISLCSVAILVARRLELPVAGINSPGHFLGFYGDIDLRLGTYFDPFRGFKRLNRGELQTLLAPFVPVVDDSVLRPASDAEILARGIRNLLHMYEQRGNADHVRGLQMWLEALPG